MAGIKISGLPYPFALSAGAAMNGTEIFPADQTVTGVKSTVGITAAQMLTYFTGSISTLTAPVVINSTAGQVSLTVNGASGQAAETINNGPLYIAPTGGNQIVLGATGANYGAIINTAAQTWALGYSGAVTGTGTAVLSWDAVNGVTIAAPSGAVPALTVNANASDTAFQIQATASNSAYEAYSIGGTVKGYLGFAGVANTLAVGSAAGDLVIRTQGGAIDFSANSGTSVQMQLTTAGGLLMTGATGGSQGAGTINATGLYINGVAVGGASTNYLLATATQTKNSTVMGNSTFLTYAIPATGTYQVECLLIFYNSSSTPGVDFNLNYSGTFTANSSPVTLVGNSTPFGGTNVASAVSTIQNSFSTVQTTAANPSAFFVKATLVATGTGTLAVAFSQNSASAGSPTTLGIGSYMNVTKVA